MPKKVNIPKLELSTNKVFQVLGMLSASDRKSLSKFMDSPYFNQSKLLIQLCETLLKILETKRDTEGFDKLKVWKKLFPDQDYNDTNFRKHCSDLLRLVEEFLAVEELRQHEPSLQMSTFKQVVKKRIDTLYNSSLSALDSKIKASKSSSSEIFYTSFEREKYFYDMMGYDLVANKRYNVELISINLDLFYWIEKLKLCYTILSQNRTEKFEYEINYLENFTELLQGISIEKYPEMAVYYYIYMTRKEEENVEHFYKLKAILNSREVAMSSEEAVRVYESAINYCTGRLNKRDEPFWQEYFDIFVDALNKGLFTLTGEMKVWRFNNVIGVALKLKQTTWTEKFIHDYKKYLPESERENLATFALARLYFHEKKYSKILVLLKNVEFADINYELIGRAMTAVSYYEEADFDALDSFLDTFRVYITRHKNMPTERRVGNLNFIKYIKKILKLIPNDKAAVEKLKQDVLENKNRTRNYDWILEKLNELG